MNRYFYNVSFLKLSNLTCSFYLSVFSVLFFFFFPRISQNINYHNFAGDLSTAWIPNRDNVLSNIFFCLAGIIGLIRLKKIPTSFEKFSWQFFYLAILFVGFGSGYYHYHPTTLTLFWDRLPMTLGFAALVANFLSERFTFFRSKSFFWTFILFSGFTAFYWILTEIIGKGDLKLYALVQFGTMILVFGVLLKKPFSKIDRPYWILFSGYTLAKVAEALDYPIYSLANQFISGHVLKHIIAGIALCIFFPVFKKSSR